MPKTFEEAEKLMHVTMTPAECGGRAGGRGPDPAPAISPRQRRTRQRRRSA